ncbi:hypothetical protein AB3R30_11770 [Leptolyngbyaceae cyanobacterium UHCC 1019]
MLTDSNNECSPLADTSSIQRAADLARSSTQFRSVSVSDRRVAPLAHSRFRKADPSRESPVDRQGTISELQALRQVAYLGEQQKRRNGSIRKEVVFPDGDQVVGNFAAPLSPLKERDLRALSELFLTDKMSTIEADIAQLLIRLQPEPCWEDDPFAFLQDFL